MDVKIISEKTYADTLERVINIMRSRKVDLNTRHILFVPDKYTLVAERMLYRGTAGAFDAEVLTLNRLFFRLNATGQGVYLSKMGAVMLMRKLVLQHQRELKCFSRCAMFNGFAEKLYETIAQFIACRILPEDIPETDGALGRKLYDIKLIYSHYLIATKGLFIDAGGRHELLYSALKNSNYFDNTVCYFANFDSVTAQISRIIDLICAKSKLAYKGEPTFGDGKIDSLNIYEATDAVTEFKAVAKKIRAYAFDGMDYGNMCVINGGGTGEAVIRRIFNEYEIPCYIEQARTLSEHQLAKFLRQLFAAADGYRRQEVISFSKNPYLDIDKKNRDIFENYCNKYCIDYLGFCKPFDKGLIDSPQNVSESAENKNVAVAETVRAKIMAKISYASVAIKKAFTAREIADVIIKMIDGSEKTTERLREQSGEDWGDVQEKITSAAQILITVFGDSAAGFDTLFTAFSEGLSSESVSLLPNLSSTVTVASPASVRGSKYEAMFITGFSDSFPAVSADSGIITDNEIDKLKEKNVDLQPKILDVNERARLEAQCLLSAASSLYVSYIPPARPSGLLVYATAISAKINKSSTAIEREKILQRDDYNFVAEWVSCFSGALEQLCLGVGERLNGGTGTKIEAELYSVLGEKSKKYLPSGDKKRQDLTHAGDIFFKNGSTTISRIQEYFACPYKHFLKYGLRLAEREDGLLNPLDIGNFLHKVIEIFVCRGEFENISEKVENIVEQTAEQDPKYRLEANDGLIQQITSEAVKIAEVVAAQISGGSYKSVGQEMRFDARGNGLKTLQFEESGKQISLTGIIDRVDAYGEYARVIDYKTGQVKFAFNDLYYGLKIQIMLYMRVLKANGYRAAGMFYFPFSARWSDDAFSHRLLGVYNNEHSVAAAMDFALNQPSVSSQIIAAKTTSKLDNNGNTVFAKDSYGYNENELDAMSEYAYCLLKQGAKEILEGSAAPSPYKKSGRCICSFCEVRVCCGYDYNLLPVRELDRVSAHEIIKSVNGTEQEVDGELGGVKE